VTTPILNAAFAPGEKPLTVFRNTAPHCSAPSKGGKPVALTELADGEGFFGTGYDLRVCDYPVDDIVDTICFYCPCYTFKLII
jgi:hypothetical protein